MVLGRGCGTPPMTNHSTYPQKAYQLGNCLTYEFSQNGELPDPWELKQSWQAGEKGVPKHNHRQWARRKTLRPLNYKKQKGSTRMETTELRNHIQMPVLSFGVFQITDAAVCEQAVMKALKTGYRLIETAACYSNERAVDNAFRI